MPPTRLPIMTEPFFAVMQSDEFVVETLKPDLHRHVRLDGSENTQIWLHPPLLDKQ